MIKVYVILVNYDQVFLEKSNVLRSFMIFHV